MAIPKVLVVDDCRMNSLLLRHILSCEGIPSDSAATGPEALEKAVNGKYELILLDIMLPGMNGFEIARHLREQPLEPQPRIYMLTAMGEHFRPELVEEVGADGHFFKPIVPSAVRSIAQRLLGDTGHEESAGDSKEPPVPQGRETVPSRD